MGTGILQDLNSPQYQTQHRRGCVNIENEAESAYASALALAQTFEDAKKVLVSMSVETTDGKAVPILPWLHKIKLCLMNQIDDKAINAAGLNTLSFILLLQLQDHQMNRAVVAAAEPVCPMLRSLLPLLTPKCCFLDIELYHERARLIFQLTPHASSELRNSFLLGFQSHQHSYFQSIVVKVRSLGLVCWFGFRVALQRKAFL